MSRASFGTTPGRRRAAGLAALAVVAALVAPVVSAGDAVARSPRQHGTDRVKAPTGALDATTLARLHHAKLNGRKHTLSTAAVTATAGTPVDPIDLRVLVLATTGDPNPDGIHTVPTTSSWDDDLSTLTSALDYAGVPYDTYKSATQQLCVGGSWKIQWAVDPTQSTCTTGNVVAWTGGVGQAQLWDGGVHAYYEGVMQTNGTLLYMSNGSWQSGLTSAEWTALWTFEAQFGIRSVSAYTYPTADFGLQYVSEGSLVTAVKPTAAGATLFPYLQATASIPINASASYDYQATALNDGATTPVLVDQAGYPVAVVHTYATQGNRQTLALTLNSAQYLLQSQVLGYGLVNWVTKGLFLGQRTVMIDPQPDDVFIGDGEWLSTTPCGTSVDDPSLIDYRITGADLSAYISWQTKVQRSTLTTAFTTELPFVGEGSVAGYTSPARDTLTPVARNNQSRFKWVNHTYDHQNLDAVTYAQAATEITSNNAIATKLGFRNFSTKNLIQPDISGLTNAAFLQAAYDNGVRYLISDTSRTGDPAQYGANEGRYNALVPGLLEVARYPVNLYFNVRTPAEWLAEDNCLYPAGAYGHVDTYAQLLDRESNNLLKYMLTGSNRPLMFHQTNLAAYSTSGQSLLSDLLDATFTKYRALVKIPVTSPTMDAIGALQANRMTYNQAIQTGHLKASLVPGTSITLTSDIAVTVPITGENYALAGTTTVTNYAGQYVTYVKLAAGVPVTIPLKQ